jgi:hypothetical protein
MESMLPIHHGILPKYSNTLPCFLYEEERGPRRWQAIMNDGNPSSLHNNKKSLPAAKANGDSCFTD